jgi:hypothetical protein
MTRSAVDFVPTTDPLLRHPSLPHSIVLDIMGIETCYETNSVYVRDLVEETFRPWARHGGSTARVHVRVVVHDGEEGVGVHPIVRYISTPDGRLILQSPGSVAIVDGSRRESLAYVTTALAGDREHFRTAVLEAITFALLACFDRHPVHAAAIARAGRVLLLAGPSGMGKSTIAYLAHTAGMSVLSDDRVWVQLEPHLRIWSGPATARLKPASVSLFPELRSGSTPANEEKVVVPLTAANNQVGNAADQVVVCVLARGDRAALDRTPESALAAALMSQLAPGFDRFPDRVDRVIGAVTAGGGWRLTLTNDARDALPFIRSMLETD